MLNFGYYRAVDKDFGNTTTQLEDPGDDLFDQWLNQEPTTISGTADGSEDFRDFDFAFDEETVSSGSYSTGSKTTSLPSSQPPSTRSLRFSPPQRPLPLRSRPSLIRCEAPTPRSAISSSELLNLEGRLSHNNRPSEASSKSSSSASAVPPLGGTLRRKAKFCAPPPEPQRGRSQKVSKTASSEMMRPSYHYRQDTPACHEWTRRFEQISLQTPNNTPQASPPRTRGSFRDNRPGNIVTTSRECIQQQPKNAIGVSGLKSEASQETCTTPQTSFYNPLPNPSVLQGQVTDSEVSSMPSTSGGVEAKDKQLGSERTHPRVLRHPSSWNYLPISPLDLDFSAVSPNHVQPSWLHNLPENVNVDSYQHNASVSATRSAPGIAQPSSDYTGQDFLGEYEPFGEFVNEDPSIGYSVVPSNPLQSLGTEEIPIALYGHDDPDLAGIARPRSPHLRSLSVSPPLHSPIKPRGRTKLRSHKKTKSVGQLKQPKSSSTLKSAKSYGNIRSPKATGSGFDNFVNFTAHDSDRILTGVAPSGSSKTKARREQEANEKKRKLSLAALRAIQEAGGDVNAVEMLKAEFDD
ncbi:hypothetical protein IMSHALPRED_007355 [Imshaugia aleurites]|uniref:Developmental regulatory protein wetA n=1 Tax=Imshaugia aleurites TaxID=172621 RepID=A0A8H3IU59_9LECA|nr:hypothetical protein IMSHALPRED_007355 [Imshaugia aleurites]